MGANLTCGQMYRYKMLVGRYLKLEVGSKYIYIIVSVCMFDVWNFVY